MLGIRTLSAATAVAIGFAPAAFAATTIDYDLWLRYDGTSYTDVEHWATDPDSGYEGYSGNLLIGASLPGLKSSLFGGLTIGDIVHFVAKVVHVGDPVDDPGTNDNGGRTPVCSFGPWDCTATNYTDPPSQTFSFSSYDVWFVSGSTTLGDMAKVDYELRYDGVDLPLYSDDGEYAYVYDRESSLFTVVDAPEPAPVPLPAAATLLPLGFGALALMRKRRRPS